MDFKYFCTNGGGLCTRCRFLFLWLFSAGNAILYIKDFPRRKDRFRGIANRISGHCGRPSGRPAPTAVRTPPATRSADWWHPPHKCGGQGRAPHPPAYHRTIPAGPYGIVGDGFPVPRNSEICMGWDGKPVPYEVW